MINLPKLASSIVRKTKLQYSRFHANAYKMPFYSLSLLPAPTCSIMNRLNIPFPSEYSIDLISQSHIVVLKCSGRSVFIRDIPKLLVSNNVTNMEKAELHSFSWISLLNLNADKQWRLMIKNHTKFWINTFKLSDGLAWSDVVTSERLYNWIVQYNLMARTSDIRFQELLNKSIIKQFKLLKRRLYLPLSLPDKSLLVRSLMATAVAIQNTNFLDTCIDELMHTLQVCDFRQSHYSTQELLSTLRYLIDIQLIASNTKKQIPQLITDTMSQIAIVIRQLRHPDGGISIFQSNFTPSIEYVDAVLSHVDNIEGQNCDAGYSCIHLLSGAAFINRNNRCFPLEFSLGRQRIILGSYLHFNGAHFSEHAQIKHSIAKEKNNTWFVGTSQFSVNDLDVNFEKKLYINSAGTDVRCSETILNSPFDAIHYIVLPSNLEITPLEYQNGFFMDLQSGVRWSWSFNKEANISFDFEKNGILNGKKMNFTLLIINSPSSTPMCWNLKKI